MSGCQCPIFISLFIIKIVHEAKGRVLSELTVVFITRRRRCADLVGRSPRTDGVLITAAWLLTVVIGLHASAVPTRR